MSLFKALQKSIWIPAEIIKDIVTLGGVITEAPKPYTLQRLEDIQEEIDE